MIENKVKEFFLPYGVKSDGTGLFKEKVVVVRENLDPIAVLVGVLADELINRTDSAPGNLRVNVDNFREYDDTNPQFGSITDFCAAASWFAEEKLGLKLSDAMTGLEKMVTLAANERELRYKGAFLKRRASGEQLGNLSFDIERAAADLTRMYGRVLVLRDYVDGKLETTPRGEEMTPMPYTRRQSKEPTAYEASVQLRLDKIRGEILKRLQ